MGSEMCIRDRQWNEVVSRVLKRLDHTNIMLVIAGTYTPLSLALLAPDRARVLLTLVWVGAVLHVGSGVDYIVRARRAPAAAPVEAGPPSRR